MTSKRERYERANMRGGMGVRKRLGEDSLKPTYRLNGVQTGSAVVRAHDKYFADFTKGFDVGILVRKAGGSAHVHWIGDEKATVYDQGDARYEVDRGRWRFLGPVQGNPLDPSNPMYETLTRLLGENKVQASADAGDPAPTTDEADETEETEDSMAKQEDSKAAKERAAAKKQLDSGDLQERETYTAKQVATRCGTDSKTMRKFFRSNHSTVEAVGQGGRYEFDSRDLPKIKREFDAWQGKAEARRSKPKPVTEVHTEQEIAELRDEQAQYDQEHIDDSPRRRREAAMKPSNAALTPEKRTPTEAEVHTAIKRDRGDDDYEPSAEELDEMEAILESGLGDDLIDLDD